eukprot:TRINITY_DN7459_c0_g1_i1.p1 TRINITY_DN7459_c0_g1~~TRINITY_DN7459_c0_g1_i1.p1  ORF type:complete len:244 (+),score=20.37 TRINITY_DN7459_c0_g1_i1:234-965(+)
MGHLLLGVLLVLSQGLADCTAIHNLYWNASNPLFAVGGELRLDVNGGNHPWEYDQVNLICPQYPRSKTAGHQETYIIYSVSRQEYETCRVTSASPKIVALCNRPSEFLYFTITFRSFTPTPGGLEFEPGKDYYFVSTSSKDDIQRRVSGYCTSHNMRVIFHVAGNSNSNDNNNNTVIGPLPAQKEVVDREVRQSNAHSSPIIIETPNIVRKEQRISGGALNHVARPSTMVLTCLHMLLFSKSL